LQRVPAHAGLIYDLDWAPDSNKIVVCSADRTATVWSFENKGKPQESGLLENNSVAPNYSVGYRIILMKTPPFS